ncbi:MAG: hypothetical protein ACTSUD_04655 [Alphaproteobacteria bacterium]
MTAKTSPGNAPYVAGVFHNADAFMGALQALLTAGFERASISVLADHQAIEDHFGRIPKAEKLTERGDTPREDLDIRGGLNAAIAFIAETAAIIGEIGAAGIAFAIGGPVGVASGASTAVDLKISDVMSRFIDARYHERYEQSVADGGVICWVHVQSAEEAGKAKATLSAAGGTDVHDVDLG